MADGIYLSMCGAVARSEQLDAIADNLANVQTPGFKAARPAFEAFLPASGARDKAYAAPVATGFDLRPGATARTDNPLDVLPEDGAFLTVQTPGGEMAYTRDGRISLDAQRRLVVGGNLVLGRSGHPVVAPRETVPTIGPDGVVRAGDDALGDLGLVFLEGPVGRVAASLYAPGRGGRAVPAEVRVRTGELELGNSSALEATIDLISAQRHFEASMQAIQTYRKMDDRSVEIGRVR